MSAVLAASCVPVHITDRRVSGLLVIEWDDGAISSLRHGDLRQRCRCAACTQRQRSGQLPDPPAALSAIRPVADKGLNLVFADGHERGIYPWTYLRELGDESA
ncbi:DUF971 domain-containing protein [Azoarcus communis]|jgi:prepilin-type processing-associated H-X9-DG protein|uniref:DUF971 domain-containing protein n=1 Tax=Parazoarcus communis SWub3 = DSM 12120 TaxID=1121029 RepID=A0A323UWK2_9RHOO|nr:DUF971 domain-containing protein [Parazoarcus communis]NMG48345.1 DUF971 domain-containing protein [Parazoarcus communis]NMG72479.1 DUF971 domain-containing protein [Parazoarcus communis SWub3 = DSM 12120]PZA15606.1 DUF971 domain-containing protein [Azoarcus communis] [Parazoarcus communis SWub3 = DSM 12120]